MHRCKQTLSKVGWHAHLRSGQGSRILGHSSTIRNLNGWSSCRIFVVYIQMGWNGFGRVSGRIRSSEAGKGGEQGIIRGCLVTTLDISLHQTQRQVVCRVKNDSSKYRPITIRLPNSTDHSGALKGNSIINFLSQCRPAFPSSLQNRLEPSRSLTTWNPTDHHLDDDLNFVWIHSIYFRSDLTEHQTAGGQDCPGFHP